MEESNDPVDGDKDEREQGVVHKGKPKCWFNFDAFNKDYKGNLTRINLNVDLTLMQLTRVIRVI